MKLPKCKFDAIERGLLGAGGCGLSSAAIDELEERLFFDYQAGKKYLKPPAPAVQRDSYQKLIRSISDLTGQLRALDPYLAYKIASITSGIRLNCPHCGKRLINPLIVNDDKVSHRSLVDQLQIDLERLDGRLTYLKKSVGGPRKVGPVTKDTEWIVVLVVDLILKYGLERPSKRKGNSAFYRILEVVFLAIGSPLPDGTGAQAVVKKHWPVIEERVWEYEFCADDCGGYEASSE